MGDVAGGLAGQGEVMDTDNLHAGVFLDLGHRSLDHVTQRYRLAPPAALIHARQHDQVLHVAPHTSGEMVHPKQLLEPVRVDLVPLQLVDQLELPVDQSLATSGKVVEQVADAPAQRRLLGDVADVQHQPVDAGIVGEVGADALHVTPRPVAVLQPAPEVGGRSRRRLHHLGEGHADVAPVVGMDEVAQGGADEVGGSPAEQPLHRGALVGDRAVGGKHRDEVRGVVHQRAELGSLLSASPPQQQSQGEGGEHAEQPKGDLDPDQPAEGCLGHLGDLPGGVVGDARQLRAQHPQPGHVGLVLRVAAAAVHEAVAGADQLVDEATVLLELEADPPVAGGRDLDPLATALGRAHAAPVQQHIDRLAHVLGALLWVGLEAVDHQQDVRRIALHQGPLARGGVDDQRRTALLVDGSRVVADDRGHEDDEHRDDPAEPATQAQVAKDRQPRDQPADAGPAACRRALGRARGSRLSGR